jgi:hypothetical protein
MREEVVVSNTRGDRAPDSFGDARANFFDVGDVGSCREGISRWMGMIGTSNDAYGRGEGWQKGLG